MQHIKKLQKYNKFIIALATVLLAGLVQVYGDNQWVQLAVALAGAFGVYIVKNKK